jgi:uncharacterized membrane protein
MILKSHILSMVLYTFFVCVVLALIRRDERKAQIKYALSLFIIMIIGAIIFGWFMFLFI